ncbi:hypothetical protein [Alloyangia pacifica]|uniref:hypothetical protein n=1 Tax=Alloyangia pacifica TaxID=311180 RepID=UPI001CFF21F4|nr:hypothetical protein [Alloyangia pacifica]
MEPFAQTRAVTEVKKPSHAAGILLWRAPINPSRAILVAEVEGSELFVLPDVVLLPP